MSLCPFPTIDAFRSADTVKLRSLFNNLLDRIQEKESTYRIFSSVPPQVSRVLEEVNTLAGEHSHTNNRPPLFGVPVGVKGIFRITGCPIRCGSLLPSDLFEGQEAAIVSALRKAGAVIIGNTATTEFAYSEPAATCNPLNIAHTPGGSSSGSAAGVAAGFFPLGVGTQTIGSIIRPAAYCGVTGFKPSYGLLSTKGVIYFSRSVDHVGFFTVTPTEMATVFRALTPERSPSVPVKTVRLGVPVGPYLDQALPDTLTWFDKTLAALTRDSQLTVEVVKIPFFEDIAKLAEIHKGLIAAEFWSEHEKRFERYRTMYRPRTVDILLYGKKAGPTAIDRGQEVQIQLRERLHEAMREHGLTAWVCPSAVGEADKGLAGTGNPCMNMPWTYAGLPALTIPAGQGRQGLPLGLQIVSAFNEDQTVLALGEALYLSEALK